MVSCRSSSNWWDCCGLCHHSATLFKTCVGLQALNIVCNSILPRKESITPSSAVILLPTVIRQCNVTAVVLPYLKSKEIAADLMLPAGAVQMAFPQMQCGPVKPVGTWHQHLPTGQGQAWSHDQAYPPPSQTARTGKPLKGARKMQFVRTESNNPSATTHAHGWLLQSHGKYKNSQLALCYM